MANVTNSNPPAILRNCCATVGWEIPDDVADDTLTGWVIARCDVIDDPVARERAIELARAACDAARQQDPARCAAHLQSVEQRIQGQVR